jgi:hypothetical protein
MKPRSRTEPPPAVGLVLKLLRVHFDDHGRMRAGRTPPPRRPEPDEAWWKAVLAEPRGRAPTEDSSIDPGSRWAYLRLDRQPADITVVCDCGYSTVVHRDEMLAKLGAATNILWLARKVIDCGSRNKISNNCRARPLR